MNTWLTRLCRKTPPPHPLASAPAFPPPMPAATDSPPAPPVDAAVAADSAASPAAPGACGWFDSSLDLRDGLAVSEVRNPDWTVLVLWFGPAALRASAPLH